MDAADPGFGPEPADNLHGNPDSLRCCIGAGLFHPFHDIVRHSDARNPVIQVFCHFKGLQRTYPYKDEDLIKQLLPFKIPEPSVEAVRVEDQICLEELSPCVYLLPVPYYLECRILCEG